MISLLRRPRSTTLARRTGTVLAVASAVEMTAIVGQVIRGQQGDFNETTPFNAAVHAVMGATVVVIFTCTAVVAVAVVMTPLPTLALTVLPAAARLTAHSRVQIVFLAAGSDAGIVALTLRQALRGQSIVHPDRTTGIAVVLLLVTAALGLAAVARSARRHHHATSTPNPAHPDGRVTPPVTAAHSANT